jgi:hypothetical protein
MYALTVVRCLAHKYTFTLYPPAHFPYGRSAIAPVDSAGSTVRVEDSRDAWRATVFKAAVDANESLAWRRGYTNQEKQRDIARKHEGQPPIARKRSVGRGCWSTQERALSRLLRVLGLAPGFSTELRQWFATLLVVPTLILIEGARRIAADPGHVVRGHEIVSVLSIMELQLDQAFHRLLVAGWTAGTWGRPLLWEPAKGVLRDLTHGLAPSPP